MDAPEELRRKVGAAAATSRGGRSGLEIRWHDPDATAAEGDRLAGGPPHRRGHRARVARRRDLPGVVGALHARALDERARGRGPRPRGAPRCGSRTRDETLPWAHLSAGLHRTSCGTTTSRRCAPRASRTAAGPRATTAAPARPTGSSTSSRRPRRPPAARRGPARGWTSSGAVAPVERRALVDASVTALALPERLRVRYAQGSGGSASPRSATRAAHRARDAARVPPARALVGVLPATARSASAWRCRRAVRRSPSTSTCASIAARSDGPVCVVAIEDGLARGAASPRHPPEHAAA